MKLNGWTRLWAVLSVAWMLFAGYLAYVDLSDLYTKGKYSVAKDSVGEVIVIFSKAQPQSEVEKHIKEDLLPSITSNPAQYVGTHITEPYDSFLQKHRAVTVWRALALVIFPPLCLLAVGWSIAWVKRGFQQPAHAQPAVQVDDPAAGGPAA